MSTPPDLHSSEVKATPSQTALASIASLINDVGCESYSLHVTDRRYYADRLPNSDSAKYVDIRLTIVGRTAFEEIATLLGAKTTERIVHVGQRAWVAETKSNDVRLLLEGVSFQHHDDWEPRP